MNRGSFSSTKLTFLLFVALLDYSEQNSSFITINALMISINQARTDPWRYSDKINKTYLMNMKGSTHILWNRDFSEGNKSILEAIAFLRKQKSLNPLKVELGLTISAYQHSAYLARTNKWTHTGPDGEDIGARIEKFGTWKLKATENLGLTAENIRMAELVVMEWIIDDGVKSRGHRLNIMNKDYGSVGVGIKYSKKEKDDIITLLLVDQYTCNYCMLVDMEMMDQSGWTLYLAQSQKPGGNALTFDPLIPSQTIRAKGYGIGDPNGKGKEFFARFRVTKTVKEVVIWVIFGLFVLTFRKIKKRFDRRNLGVG